jgi:ubiquinone/menaquinone biosynthesis C-methylase UbiE
MSTEGRLGIVGVARRAVGAAESARASRLWWDSDAEEYHAEHGAFLGVSDFVWCPERLREQDVALLGGPERWQGKRILEVGAGSAMCSRWLAARGGKPVALDISGRMLAFSRDAEPAVPMVQADAGNLPFRDDSFDIAFSAYGAIPFVADSAAVMSEVARVLRPGGTFVFATSHPIRWAFPDSPDAEGLTATMSYFDRAAYVEFDARERPTYVEHHRTLGDRVREIVAAGFHLRDIVEPEWPADLDQSWGGWSPLRGRLIPGTAIFCCRLAV